MKTIYRLGLATLFLLGMTQEETAAQSPLVITEIHYNPCSEQGPDGDFEFIEIWNSSGAPFDLEGCVVSGAFSHVFSAFLLDPGAYLVLASNASSFDSSIAAIEWDSGSINNTGEEILLHDAAGNLLDQVFYSSSGEWPNANGNCFSLELIDPGLDNNQPLSWCAQAWFGSPGLDSTCGTVLSGCTDPSACNFDPAASTDDESCEYPGPILDCDGLCISDLNANGICDELEGMDLSMICGAGTTWDALTGRCIASDGCPYDLTGDSTTSTNDILILLSHFGEICAP